MTCQVFPAQENNCILILESIHLPFGDIQISPDHSLQWPFTQTKLYLKPIPSLFNVVSSNSFFSISGKS